MDNKTLPEDSALRKDIPLYQGLFQYFPAALAGVAKISKEGNRKHNGDGPLFHARAKSTDHADCLLRHLMDLGDLQKKLFDELKVEDHVRITEEALREVSCIAWRSLALSQELHETLANAPLAPRACFSIGKTVPLDSPSWEVALEYSNGAHTLWEIE